MNKTLLLTTVFTLLFLIRSLESCAQVPVTIKYENNARTATDIKVQITSPSGKTKVHEEKNLKSNVLNYQIEGTGECKLYVHFKEEGAKTPIFISKKFLISGEEMNIEVFTSINIRNMVIPCNTEYSNRRFGVLYIKKIYRDCTEEKYPKGYENDSERTSFWEYALQSIIQK